MISRNLIKNGTVLTYKDRLHKLKSLFEKELINKNEYEKATQKILEEQ